MRKAALILSLAGGLVLMLGGSHQAAAAECPAGTAAISGLSFTVNGSPVGMSGLVIGGVGPGDTVRASFTVAPGCTAVPLNFSAYNAAAPVALSSNVGLQTLASNNGGFFAAGNHSITLTVPNCFFQIDLYRGSLVSQWSPATLLSFFSGGTLNSPSALRQMLGNATGGSNACQSPTAEVPVVTVTPPPVVAGVQNPPQGNTGAVIPPVVGVTPAAPAQATAAVPAFQASAAAGPVAVRGTSSAPTVASLPSSSTVERDGAATPWLLAMVVLAGAGLALRRRVRRAN